MCKTNSAIDIVKLACCLFIIAIHTKLAKCLPDDTSYYVEKIFFRLAVPFFFVVSGYFLGKKLSSTNVFDTKKTIIFKYCQRLLLPLVVFGVINIVEHDWQLFVEGKSLVHILAVDIRSILFYPFGALWFVQACIIGALMLLPFLRYKKLKLAFFLGFLLYVCALLCNNYYFIVEGTPVQSIVDKYLYICHSPRNGLFVGFFLLTTGVLLPSLVHRSSFCVIASIGGAFSCWPKYISSETNTMQTMELYT